MGRWIPVKESYELTECAIVTRRIKAQNPNDVTIGLPGWGMQNNTIAYMPLPKSINEDREAWKSEYFGDELPAIKKNKRFIVQLQGTLLKNQNQLKIVDLCYHNMERRWLAVPEGWEVIAWADYPKAYKTN